MKLRSTLLKIKIPIIKKKIVHPKLYRKKNPLNVPCPKMAKRKPSTSGVKGFHSIMALYFD